MTAKKIPMRQCLGCREMKPKQQLIRVVRSPEGVLSVDRKGRQNGRGAYLCPDAACLRKAVKSRALERALETKLDEQVFAQLAGRMAPAEQP